MLSHKKVIRHAASTVRMTLVIGTAHTFTFRQLLAKRCQKHCDGEGCAKLALPIDIFTLSRRCLSIGGACAFKLGPISLEEFGELSGPLYIPRDLPARQFRAINGTYIRSEDDFDEDDEQTFADALEQTGAEYGTFCDKCKFGEGRDDMYPASIDAMDRRESEWIVESPDPKAILFIRVKELKERMRVVHGEGEEGSGYLSVTRVERRCSDCKCYRKVRQFAATRTAVKEVSTLLTRRYEFRPGVAVPGGYIRSRLAILTRVRAIF
ncbi:hypothetical protein EK21DRAFT_91041 [Setomelanomma holmii]|uniref:Uncharacterized protein n=1 Tax=Setomelanomma holmii TaxID=210430 RepID=A0A9P4LLF4_9PLEO|nr:hypothetical protein EK21DRAFT_91041 [Setomelanomma holmii]